jgi:hypothetical protein
MDKSGEFRLALITAIGGILLLALGEVKRNAQVKGFFCGREECLTECSRESAIGLL